LQGLAGIMFIKLLIRELNPMDIARAIYAQIHESGTVATR
jgi:hypothetical protein